MNRPRRLAFSSLAVLAPLALLAACQVSPYSQQRFAETTTLIPFQGCSLHPNSIIAITVGDQSAHVPTPTWDIRGEAFSPAKKNYTDSLGTDWYCWQANVQIPIQYWWKTADSHYAAAVRVTDNGQPIYTYNNDPNLCTQAAGTAQLTGAAPCAVDPLHSGNATGSRTQDAFSGSMIITATNLGPDAG